MYAIVQLVVNEAMFDGAAHITTFQTLEEAKEGMKALMEKEKEYIEERREAYEEDFFENDETMEFSIKLYDYGVKCKIVDLSKKFNTINF